VDYTRLVDLGFGNDDISGLIRLKHSRATPDTA
jgi:hypothetical protein